MRIQWLLFFSIIFYLSTNASFADQKNTYLGWGKKDLFRKTIGQTEASSSKESICVISENGKIITGEITRPNNNSLFLGLSWLDFEGFQWTYKDLTKDQVKTALEYYKWVKEVIWSEEEHLKKYEHKERHVAADFNSLTVNYWLLNAEQKYNPYDNLWRNFASLSTYVPLPDGRLINQLVFQAELRGKKEGAKDQYKTITRIVKFIDEICKDAMGPLEKHPLLYEFPVWYFDFKGSQID